MENYFIHETAIVEENVKIGEKTKVWHYCHLRQGAILGKEVSLGKGVFIDKNVSIGEGSRIQNGVSIYQGVNVREWVFVGPNVTFTNDRYPRAGSKHWQVFQTTLMPGCSIGAGSIINCDVTIGSFALIGAGSVVTEDVPPFHLSYGLPSKIISKICSCGRTKLDHDSIPEKFIQPCCIQNLDPECLKIARMEISRLYA